MRRRRGNLRSTTICGPKVVEVIKYKTRVERVFVNMGCDGVPNSGKEYDDCGVCGGLDTSGCSSRPFRAEFPAATECKADIAELEKEARELQAEIDQWGARRTSAQRNCAAYADAIESLSAQSRCVTWSAVGFSREYGNSKSLGLSCIRCRILP